jgi:hypothetical protein
MGPPSLNLVDSSFEHILHWYGRHLVSIWKYEIGKKKLDSRTYLLNNHLSSFELRQNNMVDLNQCLLLNKKNSTISYSRIKSKFFFSFASRHGHKWTSICDKNGIKC